MKKVYFIDSENVGDFWLPLITVAAPEDDLLVFYTRNSPHMNYENVIQLKESKRDVTFIKCFEGTNALDFQLVTELGYRLKGNENDIEAIIVTNDTGFDAVVKYWSQRNLAVKRITGKECHYLKREMNKKKSVDETQEAIVSVSDADKDVLKDADKQAEPNAHAEAKDRTNADKQVEAEESVTADVSAKVNTCAEADEGVNADAGQKADDLPVRGDDAEWLSLGTEETTEEIAEEITEEPLIREEEMPDKAPIQAESDQGYHLSEEEWKEVKVLVNCIGKSNRLDLHNCLALIYGDAGKDIYQNVKPSVSKLKTEKWSPKKKFEQYCQLVFLHSEYAECMPKDFAGYLYQAGDKRKNLNSLRAALQKQYGKDKGMKYYSLFKTHIKLMNHM